MPWMNGGGETIEIAVWPQGAGLASFDWRVSMARVTQPGPFSSFTGVDRTLAILDGAGLTLAVAGRHPVELTAASPGYTFPADLPVTATLADGPVLALNAMTRRDRVRHALDRLSVTAPRALQIDADWALLLCRTGAIEADVAGRTMSVAAEDALLLEPCPPEPWTLRPAPAATLFVIRLRSAARRASTDRNR